MRFAVLAIAFLIALGGMVFVSRNSVKNTNIVDSQPQIGVGGGPPTDINTNLDLKLKDRAKLHTLLQEHSVLTSLALQKLYNGENTSDAKEKLTDNTDELTSFFKNSSAIRSVWDMHIAEYENYTLAVKEGDKEGAESAKLHLIMHAEDFGKTMNTLYPAVSAEEAAKAMEEHVLLTLSIVDAHAANDNSGKLTQMGKASAQAAKFAEILIP